MKENDEAYARTRPAPAGNSALEQYEEFALRADFGLALRRSRLRSALGSLIHRLCRLYEAMSLGRAAPRACAVSAGLYTGSGDGEPIELPLDDIVGSIDAKGRHVARPPRLARRDYDAWAAFYTTARERGPERVGGRYGEGGFYVDSGANAAILIEVARSLGYDSIPALARAPASRGGDLLCARAPRRRGALGLA
ncbi:MAG: hypothetical protein CVV47_15850 [Spirochaetae bacterium HGW-Spirochaetae-3]|jgi:hypothetical protein|nr:MAG: hypothetical protein CVV47_15850 [Spirochaetae bacterium HGW-Spirochaetae-3]